LAYTQHLTRSRQRTFTSCQHLCVVVLNIVMSLSSIALYVMATGYGPVAVATPLNAGASLVSNMVLQIALGISEYSKSMRVGTIVLVVAIAALVDLGPTEQHGQDALELLQALPCIACLIVMSIFLLVGAISVRVYDKEPQSSMVKALSYSTLVASVASLCQSCGKLAQMELSPVPQALLLLISILLTVFCMLGGAMAAKKSDLALFVPTYYCLQLLMNLALGLFLWQDYKVIDHWIGYICVYVLVMMGSYNVAKFDLFEHLGLYGIDEQSALSSKGTSVKSSESTPVHDLHGELQ